MLGQIPIWATKVKVKASLPACFKLTYPNTCVILDCTEIKVQTPSSKVLNSEFYSSYKSHTSYKHGIWQDAAMRIRIIHWNPHLPHNSDIFRKKQKKNLILVIKQLLNILKNIKAEEIDCFETLIFLNIEENTPFRSQDESS